MNRNELKSFSERYREAIARRIWDQWSAIGGGGYAARPNPVTWAVDPEALILASSNLFDYEPRLREVVIAWMLTNGGFVSIARLKRMQQDHAFGDMHALGELAATLVASNIGLKSWSSVMKMSADSTESASKSAFPSRRKDLAVKFDPGRSACLILKLRSLFGVSSRVEILLWMFYNARSHVSGIAEKTGWYGKTVQKTLNEMVQSGHVREDSRLLPYRRYYLEPSDWSAFFPGSESTSVWLGQHHLYSGVFGILGAMSRLAAGDVANEAATFLLTEEIRKGYHAHQRAISSLVRESYSTESLADLVEHLVTNAESNASWPVGAFKIDPHRCRFE